MTANPYTNDPATEPQRNLVERLGGDVLHAYKLSKKECSKYIDELKAEQTRRILNGMSSEEKSQLQEAVIILERLEREGRLSGFTQGLLDAYRKDGMLSPKRIACVLRQPDRQSGAGPVNVTEVGVYELDDGTIYVVKPTRDKNRLYAKRLVEINAERATEAGTVVQIEFEYAPGAIYKIKPEHKMPFERAKELTIRYGRCIVCGRGLKAARSVEEGIGPVCRKSFR